VDSIDGDILGTLASMKFALGVAIGADPERVRSGTVRGAERGGGVAVGSGLVHRWCGAGSR